MFVEMYLISRYDCLSVNPQNTIHTLYVFKCTQGPSTSAYSVQSHGHKYKWPWTWMHNNEGFMVVL